jgi:hypothetical protein
MEVSGYLYDAAVYPWKEPSHQLNRKVDGPQSWSGGSGKEKCHFAFLGFKIQTVQV